MPKILFKFPSRSRPDKFFAIIDKVYELGKGYDWSILATLDSDDPTANTDDFNFRIGQYEKVTAIWGHSTGKINAINRDLQYVGDFDIIVLLSDDMHPQVCLFEEVIKAYATGFTGLTHFPDGVVNERLCTFTVMDKKFFDMLGWLYDPEYDSVYADNALHDLSVLLGKYQYIPIQIVKHLHPCYGMAVTDDLYKRNEDPKLYGKDHNTYIMQKAVQFNYKRYLLL